MRSKDMLTRRRATQTGRLRRHLPSCSVPSGPALRAFSAEEMQRLRRRLGERIEAVIDPSFRSARAERTVLETPLEARDLMRPLPATSGRADRDEELDAARRRGHLRAMSADEERVAFLRYNYARYRMLKTMRAQVGRRLSPAGARELLRWDQIATQTRELIVQANLGLVPTMIERSRIRGVDFGELVSEGQFALLRSVEKFDCSRGFKFSTYACRSIITAITRTVALMARQRARFPAEYDPDMQKSDYTEVQRSTLEQDCLLELRSIVGSNTAELSRVEKRVLAERFGVGRRGEAAESQKTLREVAELFGVTKERVRQIQKRALLKIRTRLDERVLAQ